MTHSLRPLAYAGAPLSLPVALVGMQTTLPTALVLGVCLFIALVLVLGTAGAVTLVARRPH